MDKLKLDLKVREWVKIEPYGAMVKPFLSNMDQVVLISRYMEKLFSKSDSEQINHFHAENDLIASVIELNTNIDVMGEVKDGNAPELYLTMDQIFSHWDLWEKIEKSIINYSNFKMRLLKAVEIERENIRLRASLGATLDYLYKKAKVYLNELLEEDFSDEKLANARLLLKEAGESPVLKTIVEKLK